MTAAWIIPGTYRTPEEELLLFAGACLLGIPCGMLFDSLRMLRRMLRHGAVTVAVEDVLFLMLCGILLLGYTSAFAQGVLRMYYLWGCVLGFVLYECTLGCCVMKLFGKLSKPMRRMGRGFALICKKVGRIFVKNNKKIQKAQENTQNPLQVAPLMVYNKKRNIKKVKQHGKNKATE